MKRTFAFLTIFAIAISAIMVAPEESSAVPAFARQTGNACNACHFQFFPKLSAMGRAFKLGGYTDASVDLIGKEEDNMSLPANLPISFITKLRYVQATRKTARSPKEGTERGEWNIPDEATLYIAGRAAANIGYSLELAADGWGKGAILFGIPTGSDLKAGVYVQANDGQGPANGFDMFNTGVIRAVRGFENRTAASSWNVTHTGDIASTGLGVYAGSDMFFANVGLWGPAGAWSNPDTGFDLAIWYRAAVTPNVGGFDLMLGVAGATGTVKTVALVESDPKAVHELKLGFMGVDFQAQGEVAGMSLEVTASMVNTDKDKATPSSEQSAFDANAFLGLTPAFGVKAGMMSYENKSSKKKTNATNVGVWYQLAQNITLAPEYAIYGGDGRSEDNRLIVLLFAGF